MNRHLACVWYRFCNPKSTVGVIIKAKLPWLYEVSLWSFCGNVINCRGFL